MKDVTIIIKTFERYYCLERLIKSILKYYPDIKILIADDSRESSKEKIKNKFNNKNIIVYDLPYDCGLSYGRNYLVKNVKTKYFCLVDDDFVFDKKTDLESALEILKEKNVSILGGHVRNYKIIKNFKDRIIYLIQKIIRYELPSNYLGSFEMINEKELKVKYIIHDYPDYVETDLVCNFFIAKTEDILECLWDEDLKLQEHTAFFYNAKKKGLKVAYTNKLSTRHCPIQQNNYGLKRNRNYTQVFLKKNNLEKIYCEYDDEKRNHITEREHLKDLLISVIVPVYNCENKIDRLLNSLKHQMYNNLEIIFVDNNSKDNTIKVLEEYALDDKRVSIYVEKKQGPNYARKTGFLKSKGDYICFIDADDFIDDDTIYNYVKKITRTNSDYVIGNYIEYTTDLKFVREMLCAPISEENIKNDKTTLLYKQTLGVRCIKRDLIKLDNFVFTFIGEDMVLSKTAMALAKDIRHINVPTLNYVLGETGLSSKVELNHLIECLETCILLKEKFIKNNVYEDYKEEVEYIMTTHALYRAFEGILLDKKEERDILRDKTIKYLSDYDFKSNKYYKKSLVYKMTNYLINHKFLYENFIVRFGVKLLFRNKVFNKILKKLDSR